MSGTTVDVGLQRLDFTRKPDGWLTRLFDSKPFLVFLCMLPTIGLLLVFLTYPLGLGLWLSMTDTTIGQPGHYIGLDNFIDLMDDPMFWMSVTNTIFYTAVATVGKFALGLWLALLLNHHIPFKAFIRAIVLLPWIVPTVLSAIAWWWIYSPQFSIISYVLVDVLHLRGPLHQLPRHTLAGALVADRRQYLARHSVRGDHAVGRTADHLAVALRGGAAGRRQPAGRSSAASPCRC